MFHRRIPVMLLFVALGALAVLSVFFVYSGASAAATIQHVDCDEPETGATGTESNPWGSLKQVNEKFSATQLLTGSQVLLRQGSTCKGSRNEGFVVNWNGVTLGSYYADDKPSTALPIIERSFQPGQASHFAAVTVTGSNVTIVNIETRLALTGDSTRATINCNNHTGYKLHGFRFSGENNILRNSRASGFTAGVSIEQGSDNNTIDGNTLQGNFILEDARAWPLTLGAWGVRVNGDGNTITRNSFGDNYAYCNSPPRSDGTSVELSGTHNTMVKQNTSTNDPNFTELGETIDDPNTPEIEYDSISGTTVAYNVYRNTLHENAEFLIARGAGDQFGPTTNTKALNNTVYLTGLDSLGITCTAGCNASILVARNNILWVNGVDWDDYDELGEEVRGAVITADGRIGESNNIFWGNSGDPRIQLYDGTTANPFYEDPTSRRVDPAFNNLSTFNFGLKIQSPAVDRGTDDPVRAGLTVDRTGTVEVPSQCGVDIGAYERNIMACVLRIALVGAGSGATVGAPLEAYQPADSGGSLAAPGGADLTGSDDAAGTPDSPAPSGYPGPATPTPDSSTGYPAP